MQAPWAKCSTKGVGATDCRSLGVGQWLVPWAGGKVRTGWERFPERAALEPGPRAPLLCQDNPDVLTRPEGQTPSDGALSQWRGQAFRLQAQNPSSRLSPLGVHLHPQLSLHATCLRSCGLDGLLRMFQGPTTWPCWESMSSQECGALPFMDSKVRCGFHLATGNEGHEDRWRLFPLTVC